MENSGFERVRKERDNVRYWDGEFESLFENGLYDDGRWNSKGKYGRGKKLYWNKVSGKWVGKRYESYRSSKIWFYEFDFINEKGIVELFKDDKNVYQGFKYIDRVGYFISYVYCIGLIKRNMDDWDSSKRGIYVEKKDIIGILGSDNKIILERLIEVGILRRKIVGVNKKDRRKNIENYWLNEELIGKVSDKKKYIENRVLEKFVLENIEGKDVDWYEIDIIKRISIDINENELNELINKKYENKRNEIELELKWGKMFMSSEDKINKIKFLNSDGVKYKRIINNRYRIFRDLLNEIKDGFVNKSLFFRDEFSGRYYNVVNSIDKEFRKYIKIDGDEVVEIDMRSMYVSCLMYLFERIDYIRSKRYRNRKKEIGYGRKKWMEIISDKEKLRNKNIRGFEWKDEDGEIFDEFEYKKL